MGKRPRCWVPALLQAWQARLELVSPGPWRQEQGGQISNSSVSGRGSGQGILVQTGNVKVHGSCWMHPRVLRELADDGVRSLSVTLNWSVTFLIATCPGVLVVSGCKCSAWSRKCGSGKAAGGQTDTTLSSLILGLVRDYFFELPA